MNVFFDTNVLVYLFDADAPKKRERAREIFDQHVRDGSLSISTQVLQELYVTLTRKLAVTLSESEACEVITAMCEMPVVITDGPMVLSAIQLSQRQKLSFWDALIIESARHSGATVLLSEDLQHGQIVEGVTITNPFLSLS